MKVIFLDIDGVLNADDDFGGRSKPNPRIHGILGVSRSKVKRLKRILDETGAKIVLVSSWKYDYHNYITGHENVWGKYLRNKLRKDKIDIMDDTYRYDRSAGQNRGLEIKTWLEETTEQIESWIVLDDEIFCDYTTYDIPKHLVKTKDATGLTEELADKAIELLNKEIL